MEVVPVIDRVIIEPHRYGKFWDYNEKTKKNIISRMGVGNVAADLGFCLYRGDLYRIVGKTIHVSNEREFQDVLRAYIHNDGDHVEYATIVNILEAFLQTKGEYTISRLPIISKDVFLHDTKDTCYKFYNNCYVKITASEIDYQDYGQFPEGKYILSSSRQPRDYAFNETGKYIEYLTLCTPWLTQQDRIQQIIGYLAHEYKDETTGYIIVLIEQCADPKDGGGSGKNIFCNLFSHTTTYHSKNGSQVKFDEKFFQSWGGQRIMGISDVPKSFQYSFLKEPSTGTFILKKLFKNEIEIPVEDGPKFVIQTQFSYEISDGGLRRRIIPIEFSDFFTKAGGVDVHFGCHFPAGWSNEDWNGFDTLIIQSVQKWLQSGRKLSSVELTETGWQKQFEFTYHKTISGAIKDKINNWMEIGSVLNSKLDLDLQSYYTENKVQMKYWPSKDKFNDALKDYCTHYGITVKVNHSMRDEFAMQKKGYVFSRLALL